MRRLTIREFEQHEIDLALLVESGRLDIREDVQRFFAFRIRDRQLVIQPQGYVGLIPLNPSLAVDVQPRVDVDLARILQMSGMAPDILPRVVRNYTTRGLLIPNLFRLYAESFERAVLEIVELGYLRAYNRIEERTTVPSGRIMVNRTVRESFASGRSHAAIVSRFQKIRSTDVDDLLLAALQSLQDMYLQNRHMLSSADQAAISGSLNRSALRLSLYSPLRRRQTDRPNWSKINSKLIRHHFYYRTAISIAQAILDGTGIAIESPSGTLGMKVAVLDTAAAFEGYIRNILRLAAAGHPACVEVLDGNIPLRSGGGKKQLFDSGQSRAVSPDIVIRDHNDNSSIPLVIDIKYKPIQSGLDRTDLNQLLVYGLAYRSPRVLVIHPVYGEQAAGLITIGTIRGITVFRYAIDMSPAEIRNQEAITVDRVLRLSRE